MQVPAKDVPLNKCRMLLTWRNPRSEVDPAKDCKTTSWQ